MGGYEERMGLVMNEIKRAREQRVHDELVAELKAQVLTNPAEDAADEAHLREEDWLEWLHMDDVESDLLRALFDSASAIDWGADRIGRMMEGDPELV